MYGGRTLEKRCSIVQGQSWVNERGADSVTSKTQQKCNCLLCEGRKGLRGCILERKKEGKGIKVPTENDVLTNYYCRVFTSSHKESHTNKNLNYGNVSFAQTQTVRERRT